MTWLLLTAKETSDLAMRVGPGDTPQKQLLRTLQGRVKANGELELTRVELMCAKTFARDYRSGYDRAFKAIAQAADRHGE